MAILHTQINTRSPEFAANREAMLTQVNDLRTLLGRVSEGGGEKAQQRHVARGKLLVRDTSIPSSTPVRHFSKSASWSPMRSMAKKCQRPDWWLASAGSKASSA